MEENRPTIDSQCAADRWRLTLGGSWSAAALALPGAWASVHHNLDALAPQARQQGHWDLRSLDRLDHTGAQLLWNAWGHQWPAGLQTLPAQRAMLDRVARYSVAPPPAQPLSPVAAFPEPGRSGATRSWTMGATCCA